MREYAKIAPQFWTGSTGKRIRSLGLECQVVAIYLITAPSAFAVGMYYLPLPTLAHETGIPLKGATKVLQRLSEAGFCSYDDASELVFLPRMASFQIGGELEPADNRVKWLKRELKTLIPSPFFNRFLDLYDAAFHLQDVPRVSPCEAPSKGPSLSLSPDHAPDPALQDRARDRRKPASEKPWPWPESASPEGWFVEACLKAGLDAAKEWRAWRIDALGHNMHYANWRIAAQGRIERRAEARAGNHNGNGHRSPTVINLVKDMMAEEAQKVGTH